MEPARPIDAVDLEVIKASLSGIVQEMQNSLFRTGFSTIVRELQDASCALMNAQGDVVAQHVVLPLHIGAFPACCAALLYGRRHRRGRRLPDQPSLPGRQPHAPDMAVITPVFVGGALFGFCGSIAHKGDIGGPVPGSCSGQARVIFNEGLHLPAVRYQRAFAQNTDIERIIAANSRTPELVIGDIRGQLGADRLGERRLLELVAKYGKEQKCWRVMRGSSRSARRGCARRLPNGPTAVMKPSALSMTTALRWNSRCASMWSPRNAATVCTSISPARPTRPKAAANIRPPLVHAACAYALISLIDPHMYVSSGLLRAFGITARDGSVLNPRFPAPSTPIIRPCHALVDALFAALGPIVPGKVRADGSGSRSIIIGGRSTSAGKSYVQYEIIAGGGGARATKDGPSAITVNQSNARIAPIEIIESEFPTRVLRFESIAISAARRSFRGGLGIRREIDLADARFSIRSMKHVIPPNGASSGGTGRPSTSALPGWRPGQTPADTLRRLSAARGRHFPPRHARRRRLRRPAVAAGGARARRRARRLCAWWKPPSAITAWC